MVKDQLAVIHKKNFFYFFFILVYIKPIGLG